MMVFVHVTFHKKSPTYNTSVYPLSKYVIIMNAACAMNLTNGPNGILTTTSYQYLGTNYGHFVNNKGNNLKTPGTPSHSISETDVHLGRPTNLLQASWTTSSISTLFLYKLGHYKYNLSCLFLGLTAALDLGLRSVKGIRRSAAGRVCHLG